MTNKNEQRNKITMNTPLRCRALVSGAARRSMSAGGVHFCLATAMLSKFLATWDKARYAPRCIIHGINVARVRGLNTVCRLLFQMCVCDGPSLLRFGGRCSPSPRCNWAGCVCNSRLVLQAAAPARKQILEAFIRDHSHKTAPQVPPTPCSLELNYYCCYD